MELGQGKLDGTSRGKLFSSGPLELPIVGWLAPPEHQSANGIHAAPSSSSHAARADKVLCLVTLQEAETRPCVGLNVHLLRSPMLLASISGICRLPNAASGCQWRRALGRSSVFAHGRRQRHLELSSTAVHLTPIPPPRGVRTGGAPHSQRPGVALLFPSRGP